MFKVSRSALFLLLPLSLLAACGEPAEDPGPDAMRPDRPPPDAAPPVDIGPAFKAHVKIGNPTGARKLELRVHDKTGKPVPSSTKEAQAGATITLDVPVGGMVTLVIEPSAMGAPTRRLTIAGLTGTGERTIDLTEPPSLGAATGTANVDATGVPEGTERLIAASPCGAATGRGPRLVLNLASSTCQGSLVTVALPSRKLVAQDASALTANATVATPSDWADLLRKSIALTGAPAGTASYTATLANGNFPLLSTPPQPIASGSASVYAEYVTAQGLSVTETVTTTGADGERSISWTRTADVLASADGARAVTGMLPALRPALSRGPVVSFRAPDEIADIDYAKIDVNGTWQVIAPAAGGRILLPDDLATAGADVRLTLVDLDEADARDSFEVAAAAPALASEAASSTGNRTGFARVRTTSVAAR